MRESALCGGGWDVFRWHVVVDVISRTFIKSTRCGLPITLALTPQHAAPLCPYLPVSAEVEEEEEAIVASSASSVIACATKTPSTPVSRINYV